ncbi:hypothetical protein K3722_12245 [Leisingera caerulea]|uniref:Uncharacterized protein n=1 Tax=Leisingera caerulea TaxID=506591 RepID=A0ABY5WSU8_LEICA|nr:hypothetical protein [Leisingera caerulea]UWQ57294.1 hypothetical protein K3722_12245 [Leisingera caerulea]
MVRPTRENSNRIFGELLDVRDLVQSMETEEHIGKNPEKTSLTGRKKPGGQST